jgi:hypothetical protein
VVKRFQVKDHSEWSAHPAKESFLPDFKPYFLCTPEEFDKKLRLDLPALLSWLAWAYPETAHWPVCFFPDGFIGGTEPMDCGREVIEW